MTVFGCVLPLIAVILATEPATCRAGQAPGGNVNTAGWNHDDIFALEPGEASGPTLEPGAYFVFVAPVGPITLTWQKRDWRQFGPFNLSAGKRYEVNVSGHLEERGDSMFTSRSELRYRNSAGVDMSFYASRVAGVAGAKPAPAASPIPKTTGAPTPAPDQAALGVTIRAPQTAVDAGALVTTSAVVTGGVPPYHYEWFNGTRKSQVVTPNITWAHLSEGSHAIRVVVTDSAGSQAEAQAVVALMAGGGQANALSVTMHAPQTPVDTGASVTTSAVVTGGASPYRYEWFSGSRKSQVTTSNVVWTRLSPGSHTIRVVVTDSAGAQAEASAEVVVRPPGQQSETVLRPSDAAAPSPKMETAPAAAVFKESRPPTPAPAAATAPDQETARDEQRARSNAALAKFPAIRVADECSAKVDGAPWGPDAKETAGVVKLEEYRTSVAHVLGNLKVVYGKLTDEQAAGLEKMWAPFYDNPTPAAAAWFARLNPLLDEYIATVAAIEGSSPALQESMSDALVAMGTGSRTLYAASVPAAAFQFERLQAAQRRIGELTKAVAALGDAPNPLAARCAARARHAKALGRGVDLWTLLRKSTYVVAAQGMDRMVGDYRILGDNDKRLATLKWDGTAFTYSSVNPQPPKYCGGINLKQEIHGELSKDGRQVVSIGGYSDHCDCVDPANGSGPCKSYGFRRTTIDLPQVRAALYHDQPVLGGPERIRVFFTNASQPVRLDPPLGLHAAVVKDDEAYVQFTSYVWKSFDLERVVQTVSETTAEVRGEKGTPESASKGEYQENAVGVSASSFKLSAKEQEQALAEAIAEHEALARQYQQNAARWAADARNEKDPKIREELLKRAREISANASAERDIAASLRTGTLVRTRTDWDNAQHQALVDSIHQELAQYDRENRQLQFITRALAVNGDSVKSTLVQRQIEAAFQSPNRAQEMDKIEAEVKEVRAQKAEEVSELADTQQRWQTAADTWDTATSAAEWTKTGTSAAIMVGALLVPGVGEIALAHSLGTGFIEGGAPQMLENGARMYNMWIDVGFSAYQGFSRVDPDTKKPGGAMGALKSAAWTAVVNKSLGWLAPRLQGAVGRMNPAAIGPSSSLPAPEMESFRTTESRYEKARQNASPEELKTLKQQFDVIEQRTEMKKQLADAVARADKIASSARRADGSVDTSHPDYDRAVKQLQAETAKINEAFSQREGRDLLHGEAIEAAGLTENDVILSGGKPKNALSDFDVTARSYAAGKAYVAARARKGGLQAEEYSDRWVLSDDTTVWKPAPPDAVGSSSYEAQVIHGGMRGSDKFTTQSGQRFAKGQKSGDQLGAVIDNFKKAGEAGLGSGGEKDLHVIGKSVDKAIDITGVNSDPALRSQVTALRNHQLPEQAGIVTLGASARFKAEQASRFLNRARQTMGDAYKSAAAQSNAYEVDLVSQKRAALAAGDVKAASAIQKQLAVVRTDNRLAFATVADSHPELLGTLPPPEGVVTLPSSLIEARTMGWTPLLEHLQNDLKTEGKATVQWNAADPAFKGLSERCKQAAASVDDKLKSARAGSEEARYLATLKSVLQQGVTNPAVAIQQTRHVAGFELAEVLRQLGAPPVP